MRDVLCVDTSWRKRPGCGIVRADAVSLHPYDYKNPPTSKNVPTDDVTIGTVNRLTNALTRLRRAKALATAKNREPSVHLTEFAYFASGPLAFPRATRARYITQAFELARKNPKIAQLLYFGLLQNPDVQWNTGLLRPNGTPDASFTALENWVDARDARRAPAPRGVACQSQRCASKRAATASRGGGCASTRWMRTSATAPKSAGRPSWNTR